MTKIRFRKEKISIQQIGLNRFWVGVAAGLISAVVLSLFFHHGRESYRLITSMSPDLLIFNEIELQFFDFFFSLLASVLGLSIAIWIWMQNNNHHRKKDRIFKRLTATNILLLFWVILLVVSRFGSTLTILLYASYGYDDDLNLYEGFWILFILLPMVIFLNAWFTVRLVYKVGKWMLTSLVFTIATAFVLFFITTVDQEKLNQAYHLRFESDYQYIDQEIKNARENYGLEFDEQTVEVLKKWYTRSSIEQIEAVKRAFSKNQAVSLDTIILQKIIIRNYKRDAYYYPFYESWKNWSYPQPEDILKQLEYFDPASDETRELFVVLKEMIDLVNSPWIDSDDAPYYSETERRRAYAAKFIYYDLMSEKLEKARSQLLEDERFSKLAQRLPEISERE